MATVNVTPARNWEVTPGFFGSKATFACGECGKLNMKSKVHRVGRRNNSDLAASQCSFCGEFNCFQSGSTMLIFDDER